LDISLSLLAVDDNSYIEIGKGRRNNSYPCVISFSPYIMRPDLKFGGTNMMRNRASHDYNRKICNPVGARK
jgi:hypothetical protein